MNIFKVIETLEGSQLNEAIRDEVSDRRKAIAKGGELAMKVAIASMPFAFSLMPKMAKASTQTVNDVLNFALTLEYLEDEFYRMGLAASNLIPGSDLPIFNQISKHETAHVALLRGVLGSNAVAKPTFDFTAGGAFADVFTEYQTFAAIAQGLEDTGVRAYKGQAGELISDSAVLTTALQIHSVEARHASEVRRLRQQKGWVTGADGPANGMPAATNDIYAGENNQTHLNIDVATVTSVPAAGIREAWDEPLDKNAVLAIASLFIK